MKKIAAILLSFALVGCALVQPYTEPVAKVDPVVCTALPVQAKATCKEAADTLLKGYVTLASINGQIAKDKKAGTLPAAIAQEYLDQSKAARETLDKASDVFSQGDYVNALSQANVVDTVLATLTAALAKQVLKEQK